MNNQSKKCLSCGKLLPADNRGRYCGPCGYEYYHGYRYASGQKAAHLAVAKAVRKGILPRITPDTACVDCGKPAQRYDHRDYNKPLEVQPVCQSCNRRRGPAIWFGFSKAYKTPMIGYAYYAFARVWLGPLTP